MELSCSKKHWFDCCASRWIEATRPVAVQADAAAAQSGIRKHNAAVGLVQSGTGEGPGYVKVEVLDELSDLGPHAVISRPLEDLSLYGLEAAVRRQPSSLPELKPPSLKRHGRRRAKTRHAYIVCGGGTSACWCALRRHVRTRLALMLCESATPATEAPGSVHSAGGTAHLSLRPCS
jgi:hypothetical protein